MHAIKPEQKLYPLVGNWLNTQFPASGLVAGNPAKNQVFMSDTSQVATPNGGHWSRPDLAAMVYSRPRFIPVWSAALYTFEIKTYDGISESSVYEAVAHRRYSNFSVLVWQAPRDDADTSHFVELCSQFGVGAVTAENPSDPHNYILHVAAKKSDVEPSVVDEFVDHRFPKNTRIQIEHWLEQLGWQSTPREGTI